MLGADVYSDQSFSLITRQYSKTPLQQFNHIITINKPPQASFASTFAINGNACQSQHQHTVPSGNQIHRMQRLHRLLHLQHRLPIQQLLRILYQPQYPNKQTRIPRHRIQQREQIRQGLHIFLTQQHPRILQQRPGLGPQQYPRSR